MINGIYVKDLRRLNRDLKDIIIVDVNLNIYINIYFSRIHHCLMPLILKMDFL